MELNTAEGYQNEANDVLFLITDSTKKNPMLYKT